MAELIDVACDICGQKYRWGPERVGSSTQCRECGTKFTVVEYVPPPEENTSANSPWRWIKGACVALLVVTAVVGLGSLPFVRPAPVRVVAADRNPPGAGFAQPAARAPGVLQNRPNLQADVDSALPPPRPQEAVRELKASREQMLAALVEYKTLRERYDQAASTQFTTIEALSVAESGLKFRGGDFGLPDDRPETARARNKRARVAVQHLAARMLVFETAASERLSAALRLPQVPKVAAAIPNGSSVAAEVCGLINDGRLISELIGELPTLQTLFRGIGALLSRMGNRRNAKVVEKIVGQLESMSSHLKMIRDRLDGRMYSFDHADDTMTLQQFVIPHVPEPMDLAGLVAATEQLVERLFTFQVRIFARLAQVAEQVESVLGIPPLPDLPEAKSDA